MMEKKMETTVVYMGAFMRFLALLHFRVVNSQRLGSLFFGYIGVLEFFLRS